MSIASELTIVIPAKNEARLIPRLLVSLIMQDYPQISNTKVLVADAGSVDGTAEIALSFSEWLDVRVIPGGLPGVGRNAGAEIADTPYILFLDADIALSSTSLVRRALELAKRRKLHCVTTNIRCREGSWLDRAFYLTNNVFQHLSRLHRPFSTGMFMLVEKQRFQELGGFNQQILFAEDYAFTKQLKRSRFSIVHGSVFTTNRRLKKMGYLPVTRLFLTTALNSWNQRFFLRDHKYWRT